jgi:hypothetical protein
MMQSRTAYTLALLCLSAATAAAEEQIDVPILPLRSYRVPDNLTLRVRLVRITPEEPTPIQWRHGGEGQGGDVVRGVFPKVDVPKASPPEAHALKPGEWSGPVAVASLKKKLPERFFLTVTAGRPGKRVDRTTGRRDGYSTNAAFEFEFRVGQDVVKKFIAEGPDGGTVTIVIPAYRLVEGVEPNAPEFTEELTDVLGYAERRVELLEGLPWADGPLPRKYAIVNNESRGYARRAPQPATIGRQRIPRGTGLPAGDVGSAPAGGVLAGGERVQARDDCPRDGISRHPVSPGTRRGRPGGLSFW